MTTTFQYNSALAYDINVSYDAYAPTQSDNTIIALSHLSTRFTLGRDGSFGVVYQDTLEEIAQCVSMIVGTTIGERTVVPQFGIPQQPFDGPNAKQIETAITAWENRCTSKVSFATDDYGNSQVRVAVSPR